ncbi:MAG: GerMN domain-containing protein [Lachnospiraceae bacterium]|nr:GerMN domain-containing protein [Lachnospiraceae bacterium]
MRGRTYRSRQYLTAIGVLLMALCLTSCGKSEQSEQGELQEGHYEIYYLSNDETEIIAAGHEISASEDDPDALIEELIGELSKTPEMLEYEAPISGAVQVTSYTLSQNLLTLDFADTYSNVDKVTETLLRAAIVRTFCQMPQVDNVVFTVKGMPLANAGGEVIGTMTADQFIFNAGREINTYEKAQLTLFFADAEGTSLLPVYRTVVYNSNVLMERLIVEQLIRGPITNGGEPQIYPTLNPQTGIVNISVRDGICYVSLDENALVQTGNVTPETALYSLVNSLAELPEVTRVQISIRGDTTQLFMETLSLSNMYQRNLDIISTP